MRQKNLLFCGLSIKSLKLTVQVIPEDENRNSSNYENKYFKEFSRFHRNVPAMNLVGMNDAGKYSFALNGSCCAKPRVRWSHEFGKCLDSLFHIAIMPLCS